MENLFLRIFLPILKKLKLSYENTQSNSERSGENSSPVGFKFSHSRGSHRSYHREDCRRVIIPFHSGKIIPPGTLKNILRQAELTPEDFSKLL